METYGDCLTEEPLVSIIIPVYNGSDYLNSALESAFSQTYKNIEVVVINDGSNDDDKTDEICKSYGNRIVYLNKQNGGVASALNAGIKLAKGEYISWLSHDDMYIKDKIEKQILFLNDYKDKNNKKCILYSNFIIIHVLENKREKITLSLENPDTFYESLMTRGGFIHGCTTLIPKEAFTKVGYFNEKLQTTQDNDMWLRMNTMYDFVQMNEYFVESRDHPGQGSKVMKDIHEHERNAFFKDNLKYFYDVNHSTKFKIRNYGKLIFSFKRRGLIDAYKYSLKMIRKKKLLLNGDDLIYLIYAFFYFPHRVNLIIVRLFDYILKIKSNYY